jgi:hypothetical protein
MASTRVLGCRRLAGEYRAARREGIGRSAALDALCKRHPALRTVRDRIGDAWIERSFADHRLNENRAAWFTRAAMTAEEPFARFLTALRRGGDRIDSTRLMADHVARALGVASGLGGFLDLGDREQILLVGQLARLRGLAPVLFDLVTHDVGDVRELQDRLAALRDDPDAAAGAALRSFLASWERIERAGWRG